MSSDPLILRALIESLDRGEPAVVATVVSTSRSVPRRAGSKMLIRPDGSTLGSIGGGEMESRVRKEAAAALLDGQIRQRTYQLVDPKSGDAGVCGGDATIIVEPYMPSPAVFVVGCGHVGRAVVDLAHWMGFRVVAYDDRSDLVSAEALPLADQRCTGSIEQALLDSPITSETHVIVVTRNMAVDVALLPAVLASPARTIGVMGSKRRWEETRTALQASGADDSLLDRIMAPIGLELHAETPEEIAVSILAEIVAHRRAPQQSVKSQ